MIKPRYQRKEIIQEGKLAGYHCEWCNTPVHHSGIHECVERPPDWAMQLSAQIDELKTRAYGPDVPRGPLLSEKFAG